MTASVAPQSISYRRKAALLTASEHQFLLALEQALDDDYRVFAKVRVADVLDTDAEPHTHEHRSGFKRIARKRFSFVVCGRASSEIYCAIALDNKAPKSERQRQRDEFLDAICDTAQLPLIRFPYEAQYDQAHLRERIITALANV